MDVLGLVIAVVVLAANTHDNTAGIILLEVQVAEPAGQTVRKALADQGFKNQVVDHGAGLGIDVEIVARNPQDKGFVPQPKRWRAEQTYGILIPHRRLVRDYEHRPSSAASQERSPGGTRGGTPCVANVAVVSRATAPSNATTRSWSKEAPAPFLSDEQVAKPHDASKAILEEADYEDAETREFLVGQDGTISLLEVNTRLQVEHPVTEKVETEFVNDVRRSPSSEEGALILVLEAMKMELPPIPTRQAQARA